MVKYQIKGNSMLNTQKLNFFRIYIMSDEIWYRYCKGCECFRKENDFKIDKEYCSSCIFVLYYSEYNEILNNLFGKDITQIILKYV